VSAEAHSRSLQPVLNPGQGGTRLCTSDATVTVFQRQEEVDGESRILVIRVDGLLRLERVNHVLELDYMQTLYLLPSSVPCTVIIAARFALRP
jgi:hypothetical protein